MRGLGFYRLRANQLYIFLISFICTVVVLLAWEKSPHLTYLLPPQSLVLQLPPNEQRKQKSVPESEGNPQQFERSVNPVAQLDSAYTSSLVSGWTNKSSTSSLEKDSGNLTSNLEESDLRQDLEGDNGLRQTNQNLGVSVSYVNTEPPARNDNDNVTSDLEKEACNYGKGKWVVDDNQPLYSGFGCKQWLSGMWACHLTQRADFTYEKYKWLPKVCKMEDFTGAEFLKRMRGKTLAFVGDSLGRQQFQSLMCMITAGEERPDVLDVGREYGLIKPRGAARPNGWAYRFLATNTTVLYYWSASLCDVEPLDPTNPKTDYAMHLDRPPYFLKHFFNEFDVLVLNTGHHWNRGKLRANRWVMYVNGFPNSNRMIADIGGAKNFTIFSIVKWVDVQLPRRPGMKAFFRSISPRHFFNGDWNTGGTCDNTTPGKMEVSQDESSDPIAAGAVSGTRVRLLDITGLSHIRDEGHISRYSITAAPGAQDCMHWCLPGVPDTWNEILFQQI